MRLYTPISTQTLQAVGPQGGARRPWSLLSGALVLFALLLAGCSSDSPTEPSPNPQPPPTGGGATAFNISVTVNPSTLPSGSTAPATVTVSVRRADNGAPPANNTTLQLTTTQGNFQTPTTGPQAVALSLINGQAQVSLFAGVNAGTARVQAQLQNSFGQASILFTEADTFFLQSVSPNTGLPDGGTRVRIAGGGFVEPVRVFVGGQLAEVVSVSSSEIVVRTPQITLPVGQTLAADVSVTVDVNGANQLTDTLPGAFTYRRDGGGGPLQPQIFSVTPGSGPNEGGTQVTIRGEGFNSPVQVLFGSGTAAAFNGVEAEVRSVSSTQIIVISPTATGFGQNNQNSNVSILVRNIESGGTALRTNVFTYGTNILITSAGPTFVSYEGGTRVTVAGQGFDEPVAVEAGGVGQTPISVTGTEIIFRASAVAIQECVPVVAGGEEAEGPISVTNIETGATATGPNFAYFGPDPPFITGVNPGTIDQDGGNLITIQGGNFEAPVQVTINGALANTESISPTEIDLRSPVISGAAFDTVGCDDNGDGTAGTRNIPTSNNLTFTLTNVTTGCTTGDIQVAFTVRPSDTTCQNDVGTPPPGPVASFDFTVNDATDTATFTDTSTGNPTSFSWDFGDGNSSTDQDPVHVYTLGSGSYTVRLTVTNANGTDSTARTVVVN